jgi:hypothetical protein
VWKAMILKHVYSSLIIRYLRCNGILCIANLINGGNIESH